MGIRVSHEVTEFEAAMRAVDRATDGRGLPVRLHIGPATSRALKETLRRQMALAANGGPVFMIGFNADAKPDHRAEALYWEHISRLSHAVATAMRAGV